MCVIDGMEYQIKPNGCFLRRPSLHFTVRDWPQLTITTVFKISGDQSVTHSRLTDEEMHRTYCD